LVGDRETDVACAQAAGVRPILVENVNYPIRRPAGVIGAANLAAAAAIIAEAGCGELALGAAEMRATQA
jgi:phosphoglycolate phosphatase-like HAD superfamily hydrolase